MNNQEDSTTTPTTIIDNNLRDLRRNLVIEEQLERNRWSLKMTNLEILLNHMQRRQTFLAYLEPSTACLRTEGDMHQ
jgi:hypothetical protein